MLRELFKLKDLGVVGFALSGIGFALYNNGFFENTEYSEDKVFHKSVTILMNQFVFGSAVFYGAELHGAYAAGQYMKIAATVLSSTCSSAFLGWVVINSTDKICDKILGKSDDVRKSDAIILSLEVATAALLTIATGRSVASRF